MSAQCGFGRLPWPEFMSDVISTSAEAFNAYEIPENKEGCRNLRDLVK